jgi:hypothetical protein
MPEGQNGKVFKVPAALNPKEVIIVIFQAEIPPVFIIAGGLDMTEEPSIVITIDLKALFPGPEGKVVVSPVVREPSGIE